MIKEKISAMSDEHTQWLKSLSFYKDDFNIIKERLTEVAGKNNNKEVSGEIEHFENQIKLQGENIDILKHDINSTLAKVATRLQENTAGYVDSALVAEHEQQKGKFSSLEKVINELRQEFNRFAAKWM